MKIRRNKFKTWRHQSGIFCNQLCATNHMQQSYATIIHNDHMHQSNVDVYCALVYIDAFLGRARPFQINIYHTLLDWLLNLYCASTGIYKIDIHWTLLNHCSLHILDFLFRFLNSVFISLWIVHILNHSLSQNKSWSFPLTWLLPAFSAVE